LSEYTPTTEEIRYRLILGADPFDLNADEREDLEEFGRWLNSVKAEAWDEGHKSGLDTGITIAENVYENGGTLDLEKIPKPGDNPYRTGGAG